MNIQLDQDTKSQIRKNSAYWNYKMKNSLRASHIVVVCSVFILIPCIQQLFFYRENFEISPVNNQISIYVGAILSMIFFYFGLRGYFTYIRQKSDFKRRAKSIPPSTVKITDETITIQAEFVQTTVNWPAIKNFLIIEDCLFLTKFNDKKDFKYIFDLSSISIEEKNQLIHFMLNKQ